MSFKKRVEIKLDEKIISDMEDLVARNPENYFNVSHFIQKAIIVQIRREQENLDRWIKKHGGNRK